VGYVFHAGDGNLHPFILIPDPTDKDLAARVMGVGQAFMQWCADHDGSIICNPQSPHGIRLGCVTRVHSMSNTRLSYFEEDDILHPALSDEPETGSVELAPDVTAELNHTGQLIGIEILNARAFIRFPIYQSTNLPIYQSTNSPIYSSSGGATSP
jgi:uncharacterized protein YuzE